MRTLEELKKNLKTETKKWLSAKQIAIFIGIKLYQTPKRVSSASIAAALLGY